MWLWATLNCNLHVIWRSTLEESHVERFITSSSRHWNCAFCSMWERGIHRAHDHLGGFYARRWAKAGDHWSKPALGVLGSTQPCLVPYCRQAPSSASRPGCRERTRASMHLSHSSGEMQATSPAESQEDQQQQGASAGPAVPALCLLCGPDLKAAHA